MKDRNFSRRMSADPTRFILVGTSHAGNVGAAARALKVMGFSDLVLALYGTEAGAHARVAVGMATLPLNNAVTIAAEVEIAE